MNNKHRKEASNADKYNCPMCARMVPEENRRLDICMKCKSGDLFVKRKVSSLVIEV